MNYRVARRANAFIVLIALIFKYQIQVDQYFCLNVIVGRILHKQQLNHVE